MKPRARATKRTTKRTSKRHTPDRGTGVARNAFEEIELLLESLDRSQGGLSQANSHGLSYETVSVQNVEKGDDHVDDSSETSLAYEWNKLLGDVESNATNRKDHGVHNLGNVRCAQNVGGAVPLLLSSATHCENEREQHVRPSPFLEAAPPLLPRDCSPYNRLPGEQHDEVDSADVDTATFLRQMKSLTDQKKRVRRMHIRYHPTRTLKRRSPEDADDTCLCDDAPRATAHTRPESVPCTWGTCALQLPWTMPLVKGIRRQRS